MKMWSIETKEEKFVVSRGDLQWTKSSLIEAFLHLMSTMSIEEEVVFNGQKYEYIDVLNEIAFRLYG